MIPQQMEDPRDKLQRADRWTLSKYARDNGIDIKEDTPKMISEQILRAAGLLNPPINDVPLGAIAILGQSPEKNIPSTETVDVVADLMRQYQQQQANPDPPRVDIASMKINELRAECKLRGIPMSRRDTFDSLKAKLNGSQDY